MLTNHVRRTFAEGFDGEEIELGVLRGRADFWHEALKHLVALVGRVVHQNLVPDQKQTHALTTQLQHAK